MGAGDWWLGERRGGGLAAEPASRREEGVANFPGEGALRAGLGLAREPLPLRLQAGSALRSTPGK